LFTVRPETINRRIRDVRQLLDQAGHAIQPGPYRLASLDELYSLEVTQGIAIPGAIFKTCGSRSFRRLPARRSRRAFR
jgi:hypothetical protein